MLVQKKILFLIIVFSLTFTFFQSNIVIGKFEDFDEKYFDVKRVNLNFPEKDTYLLKIWGLEWPEAVYFNNEPISSFHSRDRGESKELYFELSSENIKKRSNYLNIISASDYSIKIRNYYGKLESGRAYILFDSSPIFEKRHLGVIRLISIVVIVLCLFLGSWILILHFNKEYLQFSFKKIKSIYFCSLAMCILLELLIYIFSIFSPHHVVISIGYFSVLCISVIGMTQFFLFSVFILREINSKVVIWYRIFKKNGKKLIRQKLENSQEREALLGRFNVPRIYKIIIFVALWFYSRKLFEKCLSVFIVSLLLSALLLLLNLDFIAVQVANVAYFCLLIGIGVRFVEFVKEERNSEQ